jgi:hypothetical protein
MERCAIPYLCPFFSTYTLRWLKSAINNVLSVDIHIKQKQKIIALIKGFISIDPIGQYLINWPGHTQHSPGPVI